MTVFWQSLTVSLVWEKHDYRASQVQQTFPTAWWTLELFITSLYNLAADCNFGELKDELICARIVVRIRDASLSERLQMDLELKLEKAKTVIRQREAVREQQKGTD